MIRLQCPLFWAVFLAATVTFAQNGSETYPKGARSIGMANANTSLSDPWSIFNNVGAMGQMDQNAIFCAYDHRLGLNELTTLAAGATLQSKFGVMGISLSNYGGELFNQQSLGLGFSHRIDKNSFGLKANYLQTNIEGYGKRAVPTLEFGGLTQIIPELSFGLHVYNITRTKLSPHSNDYLPTIIKTGISFQPTENLRVNIEAEKDILLKPVTKIGLEYSFSKRFWARCGYKSNPSNLHFGIGFKPKNFSIDYAMAQNNQLGFTHHFSFSYTFKKP
ncbi:PorV/PorQ family protein [Echinicola shivajiensis]|uniref:hypothetical protein n=1 Tax=Echinicola shivajiensis TaxID=1035916 RepID=UPI001BFCBAC8|nr:hypothetical protein [Echinicola shivajiensis]